MTSIDPQVPGQENCPGAATASAASSGAYASNVTASGQGAPAKQEREAELTRLLTADRLATYIRVCEDNQDEALRLYAWNIEIASAFWGSFNVLDALGSISPVAVHWVQQDSRVPQTISRRDEVVAGLQNIRF
ncbi:hypothetical protein [Changpingibacter yushuensis]|uniref:hypothetical protein n=1 Tax=Changpingibacter yushuensis TaxID=2758440 RepID=UPI0015F46951|nr:hypothetical protein [Changpingibacter yushuensis]